MFNIGRRTSKPSKNKRNTIKKNTTNKKRPRSSNSNSLTPILNESQEQNLLDKIITSYNDMLNNIPELSKYLKSNNNAKINNVESFMYSMGSADANKDKIEANLARTIFETKPDNNIRSLYDWAGSGETIKSIAKTCLDFTLNAGTTENIPFSRIKGTIQKPVDCDYVNYDCGFLPQTLVSSDVFTIHTPGNILDTGPSSNRNKKQKKSSSIKYSNFPNKEEHMLSENLMNLIGYDNTEIYIDSDNNQNGAKLYNKVYKRDEIKDLRLGNEKKKGALKNLGSLSDKAAMVYVKSLGDRLIVLYCYIFNILNSKQVTLFTCDSIVFLMCYILNIRCVYNTNDSQQKQNRISNVYNYNPVSFDWNAKIKDEKNVILNEYENTLKMLEKLLNGKITSFAFTTENIPYDAAKNKEFINNIKEAIKLSYEEVKNFTTTNANASLLSELRRNKLITLFKPYKNNSILYFIISRNKINNNLSVNNYYNKEKPTKTIYHLFKSLTSNRMLGGTKPPQMVSSNSTTRSTTNSISEDSIIPIKKMRKEVKEAEEEQRIAVTPDDPMEVDLNDELLSNGSLSGYENEEIRKLYDFVHEIYSNKKNPDTKKIFKQGENIYYEEDDIYDHLTYIFYYNPDYTDEAIETNIKVLTEENSYFEQIYRHSSSKKKGGNLKNRITRKVNKNLK